LDELKYEKIGEVNGRWKAEIIESFLAAEGIEVQLIQESITQSAYKGSFDLVQIFVPRREVSKARELLKSFEEFQLGENQGKEE